MESWTCDSEENDFDLPFGILQSSNMAEAVLELENTSNHGSHILTKSQNVFRNQLSMRSDFSYAYEKAISDDYVGKLLDGMDAHGHEVSQKLSKEESSSKDSSSIIDTNVQESSFIDLKLGMFSDPEEARSNTMKDKAFPSPAPRIRTKRVRTSLSSHNLVCQVHGCNADLTAAKDYHKKHKVCDAHCKTANVVVNGKTQRFCQQCSRFHMLKEFDGTKRSCRRRLAAHNERRRKPHVDIRARSLGLMNQHYLGGKFHGTTTLPTRMSFLCRNAFPFDSPPHNEKYLNMNWTGDAKLGQHPIRDNARKCVNVTHVVERPYVSTSATKLVSENTCHSYGNQRELRFASHNSLSHGVPRRHGFPGTSSSGCALYLLSNQLEGSSTCPSETPAVQHLPFLGGHPQHSEAPVYHRMGGFESHGLSNVASNALCSSGFKAMASEHVGFPDFGTSVATTFNMEDQYNSAVPAGVASGNVVCDVRGETAGLLQLSSPFMSSEPRSSVQVKQDGMHLGLLPLPNWSDKQTTCGL